MTDNTTQPHKPDHAKIPDAIKCCDWQLMSEYLDHDWFDGTTMLAAVPVRGGGSWYYEIAIVKVRCGEDYFDLEEMNGDLYGWGITDVDWFLILDGSMPVPNESEGEP